MNTTRCMWRFSPLMMVVALATGLLLAPAGEAANFVWDAGGSGDWTTATNWDLDSGDPDDAGDTATINELGTYTVTVDAPRTIGSLTLDAADATLDATTNTLEMVDTALFNDGTIQGTYLFRGTATDVDLTRADVAIGAPTTYQIRRGGAGVDVFYTFDIGDVTASETVDMLNVDNVDGRGTIFVDTAAGYTNDGVVDVQTSGFNFGIGSHMNYTVGGAGVLNQNEFNLISLANSAPNPGRAEMEGDLTNAAGATFTSSMVSTGTNPSVANRLTKAGATYINDGDWTVTGGPGLFVAGEGTSFTQSAAGATLAASQFTLGAQLSPGDSIANTFSITGGSLEGYYILRRTNATLGAGVTLTSPTTFAFQSDDNGSTDAGLPLSTFTGDVSVDLTILLRNPGINEGAELVTPGSLTNNGLIDIVGNNGADFNGGYGRLEIDGGGTLTNQSQLNLTVNNGNKFDTFAIIDGNFTNDTTGTVDVSVTGAGTGSDRVIWGFENTTATYTNRGTVNLQAGELDVNGSSLTNEAGGVIQGIGTLDVADTPGGLLNQGTLSPGLTPGEFATLNLDGVYTSDAGGELLIDVDNGMADLLAITGDLDLASADDILSVFFTGHLRSIGPVEVISYTGTLSGVFDTVLLNGVPRDVDGIVVDYSTPGSVFVTVIPEPASAGVLALTLVAGLGRRRRTHLHGKR